MSLTSTVKKENNIVELEIAVGAEELAKAADLVFKRKVKSIAVPGFRKGKAPRKIIEKMYGEGIFLEDAMNDLYPKAYSEAIDEAGIEPVDRADVEVLSLDKETGFTFKATVTVKPEVSIKDYKGIKAEKNLRLITEEDVDAEVKRMQERNARIVTVEDRAAQMDDETVIDFEGFVDGEAFPGGKGEDFKLTLGSGSFIDTYEEQIVGHMPGEEFDVNVTFPEEYHAEELKGKPALFKVKLKEIKAKELPVLDDEFAKDVSEFDTLEEMRADIRTKIQESAENAAQNELENALIDVIVENLEGDIPECMYENRIDEIAKDFEYRLASQGMNIQMYLQYTGMQMEDFRQGFRKQAERQVKVRLALEKIAELEAIEVTAEEVEAEYNNMAEEYKMEVEKLRGFVSEKDVIADKKTSKAVEIVRSNAVITEVIEKKEAAEASDDQDKPAKKKATRKPTVKKTTKAKEEAETEE